MENGADAITMPETLADWKLYFRNHIEEARCATMLDDERDELIKFVRHEAELIFYAPPTSPTKQEEIDISSEPSHDIGYKKRASR